MGGKQLLGGPACSLLLAGKPASFGNLCFGEQRSTMPWLSCIMSLGMHESAGN